MTRTSSMDGTFREEALPQLDAVYRFALRLTRDRDRSEDLTQDTFLRAYQSWETYTPGTRVKSWLFTICRNLFLRGEERSRRHHEIVSEVKEEDLRRVSREASVFAAAQEHDPEGAFWRQIVDDEVTRAIKDLPVEFREVVVLSDVEDLTYEEIAQVLELPVGTVKSRLFRGRRRLQEELYDYAISAGIVPDHRLQNTGEGETKG